MKILVTGNYEPDYNRNLIIFKGLEMKGVELIHFPYGKRNNSRSTAKQLRELALEVDAVLAPSFTHVDVRFIRRHIGQKLLIFDPLISRYLSKVFDYKKVWRYSPRALKNYLKDFFAMHTADIVLADTQAHKEYYANVIKVPKQKIVVVPVGVDTELFYPAEQSSSDIQASTFNVGFYGSFVPLQGVLKIAQAAQILEQEHSIRFEIIGGGYESKKLANFLKKYPLNNFEWKAKVPYEELPKQIQSWDLALGIFGDSLKSKLVVPNKVYHYLACGRCTLTQDSVAIREFFVPDEELKVCQNTPEAIAESIVYLSKQTHIRRQMAGKGFARVKKDYDAPNIAHIILSAIYRRGLE